MEFKTNEMILSLVLYMMTWQGAWAQTNCMNAFMTLVPCFNYVTGSSLGPSSSCCSQLNWVVQNQPECLCGLINGGAAAIGIVANPTVALALPGACNLQTSSATQCNVANGPTASTPTPTNAPIGFQSSDSNPSINSPNVTPTSTTPATPSQTTTLPPQTSTPSFKTVPSAKNAPSGATITKSPFSVAILIFLGVFLIEQF